MAIGGTAEMATLYAEYLFAKYMEGRMSMIERVAHAIAEAQYPGEEYSLGELHRSGYIAMARAAIAAMREPTEAMQVVALDIREGGTLQADVWRTMIDAALEEK